MFLSLRHMAVVRCDVGARLAGLYCRLQHTAREAGGQVPFTRSYVPFTRTFVPFTGSDRKILARGNVCGCNHIKGINYQLGNTLTTVTLTSARLFNTGSHGGEKAREDFRGNTKANFINQGSKTTLYYMAAVGVLTFGLSYAAVPLYRIFCQAYSVGGTVQEGHNAEKVETMKSIEERVIRVRFNADTAASMTWNFKPQQSEIKVHPGETALAFYTARNPMDRPVIGISTYNVIPFDAGQYFNKIQCFCFEEQQLNPREEVHMPVFFYIDPEFAEDPKMQNVDVLTLSYTFFEAREGVKLPLPNFAR